MEQNRTLGMGTTYDDAKMFLIGQILNKLPGHDPEILINQYLSLPDLSLTPVSLEKAYQSLLESAQNAGMKDKVIGGSIGGVGKFSEVLCGFNPQSVLEAYGCDYNKLLADIERELKPTGQIKKTTMSIWPKYCKTILSAARFLVSLLLAMTSMLGRFIFIVTRNQEPHYH
ncbi:MAG: hypothetical protein AB9917_17805 [Negativicutes bacterium]